jgi:hypothetical protein
MYPSTYLPLLVCVCYCSRALLPMPCPSFILFQLALSHVVLPYFACPTLGHAYHALGHACFTCPWLKNSNPHNKSSKPSTSPICITSTQGTTSWEARFITVSDVCFWKWWWKFYPNIKWLSSFDGRCLQQRLALHKFSKRNGKGQIWFLIWWLIQSFCQIKNCNYIDA